ncbi:MAG: T9SS type A sorting domain-containing protein [Bacteroidota bacterium]
MIKRIFCILFLCSSYLMESQNWDSIKGGIFAKQIERVLYDSVHNKLIVSGKFTNHVGNLNVRGICSWDGTNWDSLSGGVNTHDIWLNPLSPQGAAVCCIPYQGKTLVGGYFTSIGYINTTSLALWDGVKWDSLPKRAFRSGKLVVISGFLKKNNLLYITGNFDTIAGQPAKGLATWDGINFNAVTLPIGSGFNNISSIIEYQNDIYIAGDGFLVGANNNARDVFKYNGTSWASSTGNGVLGGFSGVADLEIYNNELYASGHFLKSDGNAGDHVMKWNGSQWKDVGFGDDPTAFVSARKMLVYYNKLWVFGAFYNVANSFASMAAAYDGTSWCGLKDTLDNTIGSATVYNDTIYIGGGFWTANADSLHFIAKLKDANLFNQCINVVGVNELSNDVSFSLYPIPTNSILKIIDENKQLQNATIEIKNPLGQTVFSVPFTNQIDISSLALGMYFLTVQDKEKKRTVKVVKE